MTFDKAVEQADVCSDMFNFKPRKKVNINFGEHFANVEAT